MSEHRVPLLGDAWRRRVDPTRSADPRVRRLVTALGTLEIAPAPSPEFRSELRTQLVAVTPRLVAEGVTTPDETEQSLRRADRKTGFAVLRRPLVATVCLLTTLVLVLGGAVWVSRSALPGDVLYGLKRASENTEYALAGSTTDKGKLKLQFAATRIQEVGDLVPRTSALALGPGLLADGPLSDHTATLVQQTLGSADDDIRAAAQMLGAAAVNSGSSGPLDAIISWAPPQQHAMHVIAARLPKGETLGNAVATWSLIRAARARAVQLKADLGCGCLSSSGTDALGPVPCSHPCAHPGTPGKHGGNGPSSGPSSNPSGRRTGAPSGGSGPSNGPATSFGHTNPGTGRRGATKVAPPAGPGRAPTHRGSAAPPGPRAPGQGAPPHSPAPPSGRSSQPGHTPTPTPTPRSTPPNTKAPGSSTVPVPSASANSCGVTLGLGPVGIGVGIC